MGNEISPERMQLVTHLYQIIHNKWAETKSFNYTIIPSGDVRGKTIDDLRQMMFWVGVGKTGAHLTLAEMVHLFLIIEDQTNQMKLDAATRQAGNPQPEEVVRSSIISDNPSDDEIKRIVSQLEFQQIEAVAKQKKKLRSKLTTFVTVLIVTLILGVMLIVMTPGRASSHPTGFPVSYPEASPGPFSGTVIVLLFAIFVAGLLVFAAFYYGRIFQINVDFSKDRKRVVINAGKMATGSPKN